MAITGEKELELLIRNCQEGRPDAQRAIYDQFSSKMFGVCLRYCKSREEAEDCLQDGFVKVFQKIGMFQFKGSFEGWVRRIMVNTIMETYRKKNPVFAVEDLSVFNLADEQGLTEEPLLKEQDLLQLINQLPPQYRMVFNLYAMEDYSHEEIAQSLGISVGTSKSNLSRARQWLRDRINEMSKVMDV